VNPIRIAAPLALAVALSVALAACSDEGREPLEMAAAAAMASGTAEAAVPPPSAPAPSILAEPAVRTARKVRSGEPLDLVLTRLELTPDERRSAIGLLAREVDLRRVLPGETVEIAREADGRLREVVMVRDRLHSVVARWPAGAEPVVESRERAPEVRVRRIEGTLDGSLFEAFVAAGGDANLTMRYADLFAWQVDFLTEPRAGDTFRVLVREEWLDGERLGFGKILAAEYHGALASARAIRYVDENGVLDWYDDDGRSVRRAFLKSPLNYRRISSRFTARRRHPILKTVRPHWGVDYAAPQGTPVSALGSGVVTFAGRKGGYGNYVEVRHNGTYTTCYGHLWKFARGVRKGSRLEQGDVLGYVGSTGLSTGPHLDFRVKRNGRFVDPLRLDAPPGREIVADGLVRFARYRTRVWAAAERVGRGDSPAEADVWSGLAPPARTAEDVMALSDGGDELAVWAGAR
jgi:murein DD-endopeptidase MepM/ murein hydrolase activator NlpD